MNHWYYSFQHIFGGRDCSLTASRTHGQAHTCYLKSGSLTNKRIIVFGLTFFLFFILTNDIYSQDKKEKTEQKEGVEKKTLTFKQIRQKKREERKRRKDDRKKARLEAKAIRKHHKKIQSEQTYKRMRRNQKKANKKNKKNQF